MRVHKKIISLILIILVAVLITVLFSYFSQQKQMRLFASSIDSEKNTAINAILSMKKQQLDGFAYDYTMWDEMVSFVENINKDKPKDDEWSTTNIVVPLANYRFNIAWMFDSSGKRIFYHSNSIKDEINLPFPDEKIPEYYKNHKDTHFFYYSGKELIEVVILGVRPSNIVDRRAQAKGYFAVGKQWDAETLDTIKKLTGYSVKLEKCNNTISRDANYHKENFINLLGWDGKIVGDISQYSNNKYFAEIRNTFITLIIITIISFLFIVFMSYFLLKTWITKPVEKIIFCLNSGEFKNLENLAKNKSEFGTLAQLAISHKEQQQDLILAKRAAETANIAKSEFLANMSHEIRTPMNGVLGMLEIMIMSNPDQEQLNFLNIAKHSAYSLLNIINDILDFSKIEAGKMEIREELFNILDVVEKTVTGFSLRAHEKNLELVCDVKNDFPIMLIGDHKRLGQIIINLVGNAIKFTAEGEVAVIVEKESETASDIVLKFSVKDTGIGISEDNIPRLFKSFSQVDSSYTKKYEGTGLGLAIAKKLCELMNGSISVVSIPNMGSIFSFTILFKKSNFEYQKFSETKAILLESLNVLVVDDNQTNRIILEKTLLSLGMNVTLSVSAKEALDILQQQHKIGKQPDLILVDSQMPIMDGFQLVETIRKTYTFSSSTILMLSSSEYAGDVRRCHDLNIRSYLIKPIKQVELYNAIVEEVNNNTQRRKSDEIDKVTSSEQSGTEKSTGPVILVAEDDQTSQSVTIHLLKHKGFEVIVVNDGLEAVSALEANRIDLVLMDVRMPNMNGIEAVQNIREKEKYSGNHIPIIALTAHALAGDKEKYLAAGMDAYISKPINPAELYESIDFLLKK